MSGTTLGGGVGWIRRKHGRSTDALRSVGIVTADGELRKASPSHDADLFWAVRGGGGNFGIVTSFEFDLYEVGPFVGGLGVFSPAEHTEAVLETHHEVMDEAPEELTTILVSGHVPPLPAMPETRHGEDAVAVLGCYAGDPEKGWR
jgi:FAD/FMN-containing dehydrogenase